MTQQSAPSLTHGKRSKKRDKPMSGVERQQALIARRKETHSELRLYITKPVKAMLQDLCKAEGLTQNAMVEMLIVAASNNADNDERGNVKD
ncbi:hypothetical protein NG99_03940 [Erwinia typographi]|uniref:Protein CopB n=1 Tax=Erwinia typographi TaxID=371042 RepID=A0A0A3ZC21_9GAMM|nr:RepB family protein [Erwinia typographi]KGT95354.1 hypothetical protein NG99_03940 [Erwinia typographi]